MIAPVADRLAAGSERTDTGCWQWTRCVNSRGYGVISVAGRRHLAHRVSYTEFVGEIPDGLTIDHLCRNKRCINPEHLEPVTNAVNMARSPKATKTVCVHGHAYTPENTIVKKRRNGGTIRNCRACEAARRDCVSFCRRYLDRKPSPAEVVEWLRSDAERSVAA